MGDSREKYIQLTQLPTLNEIKYEESETIMQKIMAKSVALQLKPMNSDTSISKFAFDHLLSLANNQLNDMINQLHRLGALQRRNQVAKADIEIFLRGYNINTEDLDLQSQYSQFIIQQFNSEYSSLNRLASETDNTLMEYEKTDITQKDTSTKETIKLVPISNPLQKIIPSWLPDFPPDYTYKFTPQFNKPITDETVIRRQVAEEGKQSEKALLHLLEGEKVTREAIIGLDTFSKEEKELTKEETVAIYSAYNDKKKIRTPFFDDNSSPNTFNIEEYAHTRVEIARKKVMEYEERQLQIQGDPLLKLTRLVVSNNTDRVSKRVTNKEIRNVLKRSFLQLIDSIPTLNERKDAARKEAEIDKEKKQAEWKKVREERLRELNAKKTEFNVLDLSNLSNDNHSEFFGTLGSSDEEQEPLVGSIFPYEVTKPKTETSANAALYTNEGATQVDTSLEHVLVAIEPFTLAVDPPLSLESTPILTTTTTTINSEQTISVQKTVTENTIVRDGPVTVNEHITMTDSTEVLETERINASGHLISTEASKTEELFTNYAATGSSDNEEDDDDDEETSFLFEDVTTRDNSTTKDNANDMQF